MGLSVGDPSASQWADSDNVLLGLEDAVASLCLWPDNSGGVSLCCLVALRHRLPLRDAKTAITSGTFRLLRLAK